MDSTTEKTYKEEEYTRDYTPYRAYFNAVSKVFDLSVIESFADIGCNNGGLLFSIHNKYKHIDLLGYDYFEWSKIYADKSIQNSIKIIDLSKKINIEKRYSIVNCSEVGEHIARECEDIFLDNIANITENILILTWSNEYDTEGQHLNPRPKKYIIEKMKQRGFAFWKESADILSNTLANNLEGVGYTWWAEDIMVFKRKKFALVDSSYFIQGVETDNVNHKIFLTKKGLTRTSLQEEFLKLTEIIQLNVIKSTPLSILRASDGDYYFLRKIPLGSAKPGKRALTKNYSDMPISYFKKMFWQNDIITTSLEEHDKRKWRSFITIEYFEKINEFLMRKLGFSSADHKNDRLRYIFDRTITPVTSFSFVSKLISQLYSYKRGNIYLKKANTIINNDGVHLEVVYAIIASKWIFKNFPNRVGIIASDNKINVIRKLMEKEEYKRYLGTNTFSDYISVPEKGAADDIHGLIKRVGKEVSESGADIFLVGVGSSKVALLPALKYYKNAVFIDVGAGIDAIAGMVCQSRPYFATWTNYKLTSIDYSGIDIMDAGSKDWDNPNYKTVVMN